ncbi:MAG: DUF5677 domain-containing protein [Nitrospiraceae bacterium]
MDTYDEVILGDTTQEIRATQLLAIKLADSAGWVAESSSLQSYQVVPAILMRAADYLSLLSLGAPDPPLEIIALSARNIFELYSRLEYVLKSEANSLQWQNEAVKDQLEIYEGLFTLAGSESDKEKLREEVERVKKHATSRGLESDAKILSSRHIAEESSMQPEYQAFYKLYSKLVHPSSFSVNWPSARASPIYRSALICNVQVYANLMLSTLEGRLELPLEKIHESAVEKLRRPS